MNNSNKRQPQPALTRSEREELLLTAHQVATRLNLAPGTVYALAAARQIPSVKINRTVRFPAHLLQRWIEEKAEG